MIRSYLRWTGGKSRIIQHVIDSIGDCTNKTLIEPFVGSGTVALNIRAKDYNLNDANKNLINTHKQICDNKIEVYDMLVPMYIDSYNSYYKYRQEFRERNVYDTYKAALFIYLNAHNYNGMYRENKSGLYNVPVGSGSVKDPLQDMLNFNFNSDCFSYDDFETIINSSGCNDVIYCDPPYPSDSISDSEINYTKDGFSKEDHIRLHGACVRASKRGTKVVISYCNIEFIRELYGDADEVHEVQARRSVSSKAKTRGIAKEVIIIYNGV